MSPSDAARAARRQQASADRRWRNLCRALGYPDPDTITQERTIWSNAQIPTRRISLTYSTGTVTVTSPEIAQIVAQTYDGPLQLPPEWSPQQRQDFLDSEASRISVQVDDLAAELAAATIKQWTQDKGQHPDYMTTVGMHNTARLQAMEIVLSQELYSLIPEEPDEPATLLGQDYTPPVPRSQLSWDQRWTRPDYRTEPTEDLEELTARLWPDPAYSAVFRIKAGYLLASRAEDGLAPPTDPDSPQAHELAQLVYRDLREDGLPER